MNHLSIIGFGLLTAIMTGCVSQGTYDKLETESNLKMTEQQHELESSRLKLNQADALITDLQNRLGNASSNKAELDRSLAETRQALNELAQRKAEMEKELMEFRNLTSGLKSMIDTGSVKVQIIKGRMVVSLGSDVLFSSGSSHLSPEGKNAVREVTKQLAMIRGKDFQVEGHTDNVPIKTREFPSNWELASARALTVVNMMVGAGMPVERVSAASYADTHPATPNETVEGRAQNRRIDIAIVPDLSKLMDVNAMDRTVASSKPAETAPPAPSTPAQ